MHLREGTEESGVSGKLLWTRESVCFHIENACQMLSIKSGGEEVVKVENKVRVQVAELNDVGFSISGETTHPAEG